MASPSGHRQSTSSKRAEGDGAQQTLDEHLTPERGTGVDQASVVPDDADADQLLAEGLPVAGSRAGHRLDVIGGSNHEPKQQADERGHR